jgi:hypothetical protein
VLRKNFGLREELFVYNSLELLFVARIFVRAIFGVTGQHAFLEFLYIADLRFMT